MKKLFLLLSIIIHLTSTAQQQRQITQNELKSKIYGFWYGQLVGNYMGFPFENVYKEEPIPVFIDRYYNFGDADSLNLDMNINDRRAFTNVMADALGGAWSDDDTDIEFVTLHAVEKYGLDITYEEITAMWKKHINRFIWAANRQARDLMEGGMLPPETGNKTNNPYWYRITSQLVNEIWSVFYPGMIDKAQERALWGAHIMCDDWATHATQAYSVMFSAAFFEKDVNVLVQMAIDALPETSPYRQGMKDVVNWHKTNPDWRDTRTQIHNKYYDEVDDFVIPEGNQYLSSVVNGLCGIMAILYGEGDFRKTVGIATSAGYDCDNQTATCGGLLGIIHGAGSIPKDLTHSLSIRGDWTVAFNNQYINYSRDGLPNYNLISDIVERILQVSEHAIIANGGKKTKKGNEVIYEIKSDF